MDVIHVKNTSMSYYFNNAWQRFIEYRLQNKAKVIPSMPSPGWLSAVAAKADVCIATTKLNDKEYRVCGAPLGANQVWYCDECLTKINEIVS